MPVSKKRKKQAKPVSKIWLQSYKMPGMGTMITSPDGINNFGKPGITSVTIFRATDGNTGGFAGMVQNGYNYVLQVRALGLASKLNEYCLTISQQNRVDGKEVNIFYVAEKPWDESTADVNVRAMVLELPPKVLNWWNTKFANKSLVVATVAPPGPLGFVNYRNNF